jgi:UDP-N-acetylmuramyl pentapeptide phosphotransferase/UDP-N-acetylglucosamine-1-phosphate transferase
MLTISSAILILLSLFCASFITGVIRTYAFDKLLDIPNDRSSHSTPTPKGGGLAIVFVTLTGMIAVRLFGPVLEWRILVVYLPSSILISAVSLIDDLRSISNRIRFAVHCLGALLFLAGLGYWEIIGFGALGHVHLGLLGLPITFLWIVGLTNAYNFMDGIDGIAGAQGLIAGLGWCVIGLMGGGPLVSILGLLLGTTCLGFLFHNWPPARIFMGDVGSAFLGYTFACLAVIGSRNDPIYGLAGIFLVWPFVFDSIFTFFRRWRNHENVFTPHRSHLYQRLVISGFSHRTVTLIYTGLCSLGFFLTIMITVRQIWSDLLVIIALPIACVSLWLLTVFRENKT